MWGTRVALHPTSWRTMRVSAEHPGAKITCPLQWEEGEAVDTGTLESQVISRSSPSPGAAKDSHSGSWLPRQGGNRHGCGSV